MEASPPPASSRARLRQKGGHLGPGQPPVAVGVGNKEATAGGAAELGAVNATVEAGIGVDHRRRDIDQAEAAGALEIGTVVIVARSAEQRSAALRPLPFGVHPAKPAPFARTITFGAELDLGRDLALVAVHLDRLDLPVAVAVER